MNASNIIKDRNIVFIDSTHMYSSEVSGATAGPGPRLRNVVYANFDML